MLERQRRQALRSSQLRVVPLPCLSLSLALSGRYALDAAPSGYLPSAFASTAATSNPLTTSLATHSSLARTQRTKPGSPCPGNTCPYRGSHAPTGPPAVTYSQPLSTSTLNMITKDLPPEKRVRTVVQPRKAYQLVRHVQSSHRMSSPGISCSLLVPDSVPALGACSRRSSWWLWRKIGGLQCESKQSAKAPA